MTIEDAVAADRSGEVELAAFAYEHVLAIGEVSLGTLLDLTILYWQATDPGLAAAKNLRHAFLATAGRRVPELLAEAQRRFPRSTEVQFWKRYIAWADLGEPFGSDECRELLRQDPATLIPAMYLFAGDQGDEAEQEALALLRRCEQDGTTRARYVVSVIRGTQKRAHIR